MPAKPKPTKSKSPSETLEIKLSAAIDLASSNKLKEALVAFESIAEEAVAAGNFSLARIAKNHIAIHKETKPPVQADPIQEAVFLLNAQQPEQALVKIDKILKTQNSNAYVHYLKSLVFAITKQEELSAECLRKAIEMDQALLYIYRLEPDFRHCHNLPSFAEFELA